MTGMVKKEKASVVVSEGNCFSDFADIPTEILTPPRIQICQGLSGVAKAQVVKLGHIYNTASSQSYGEKLKCVAIMAQYGAVYITTGKGLVCKSMPKRRGQPMMNMNGVPCSQCPYGDDVRHDNWVEGRKAPKCSDQISFVVLLPDYDYTPAILNFTKTDLKEGKRLINKLANSGSSIFTNCFELSTKEVTYEDGSAYNLVANLAGRSDGSMLNFLASKRNEFLSINSIGTEQNNNVEENVSVAEEAVADNDVADMDVPL